MNKKIYEIMVGVLFTAFAMFLVRKVIIGGFFNMLWLVGVIILTVYFSLLKYEKAWHGIALGLLPGTAFTLNMYGMSSINFSFLFSSFIILVVVSQIILKRRDEGWYGSRRSEDVVMSFILGYGVIRLLYDRPGLVAFGAGEGGLMTALFFVIGAAGFFAYKTLCARIPLSAQNFKAMVVLGVVIELQTGFHSVQVGFRMWFQELAGFASWMLLPILLVHCLEKRKKMGFHFWASSFFFLLLGLVADHRTRLFFIIGIITIVAFFYKKAGRAIVTMSVVGVIGLGAMVGSGHIPGIIRRPLSLILPSVAEMGTSDSYGARNMGFKDNFRVELYELAWIEIKQNPIFGNGFGLNVKEALTVLAGGRGDDQTGLLALGGSYHNTYVSMATKLGLPLAILFLYVSFLVPIRLGRAIYRHEDGVNRKISVVLIAFYFGVVFFALINGGHHSFYIISILMGYMSYLYAEIMKEKASHQPLYAIGTAPTTT